MEFFLFSNLYFPPTVCDVRYCVAIMSVDYVLYSGNLLQAFNCVNFIIWDGQTFKLAGTLFWAHSISCMYFVVCSIQISQMFLLRAFGKYFSLSNALLLFDTPTFKTETLCLVSNVKLVKCLYGEMNNKYSFL